MPSDSYDDVDISLACNAGHNDAWESKPPKQAPAGVLNDRKHQSYRKGHAAGTTARFYYDAGYKSAF